MVSSSGHASAESGLGRFCNCALDKRCYRVSCIGRTMCSVEVIVQAHWIEYFDSRVETLKKQCPLLRPVGLRKTALKEACADYGWSEKELRNRMQAGSVPWVFRFCLLTRLLGLYGRAIARSRMRRLGPLLFSLVLASIASANIALVLTT